MKSYAYLIQVNASANNNKYYEIMEQDNGEVDVRYGRIGGKAMEKHYGYEKTFHSLKREKENKGYEDRTALHSEVKEDKKRISKELSYQPVEDADVQELLDLLITSSREFMRKNYTVGAAEITDKMIHEAENDIAGLNRIALSTGSPNALYSFNKQLQELFTDIPRKMSDVSAYLARTEADFEKIINRETEMLNNVRGAAIQTKPTGRDADDTSKTVLSAYGLDVRPVTYKEEDQIMAHLGVDYDGRAVENRYVKAFAVENKQTRAAYEAYKSQNGMSNKDVRLFYHGSKVENWYSIVKTGLSLNPNATVTGKMFGQGLYFAPETRKALNYMDVKGSHWNSGRRETGYCAVYAVALGKCYQPNRILGSNFHGYDLPSGKNSVFASKNNPNLNLRNDEYIVYDQSACTIKYLLEMSSQWVRTKEYNLDRKMLRDSLADGFDTIIKTPDGIKAELALEQLSPSVQTELLAKITNNFQWDNFQWDRVFLDYNEKNDRISFSVSNPNGDSITASPHSITADDYAFLSREMKKAFAKSENDWKTLLKSAAAYPVGKAVANKDGMLPFQENSKEKPKDIVKE